MARVIDTQRRRRDVVTAPPDLYLRLPVLRHRLRLAETLQRSVVALVEPPGALHRNPHAVHLVEHDPQRADSALQNRGEGEVDRELLPQQLARGLHSFAAAAGLQVDVGPAGEQVVDVPGALAVAYQDQFALHGQFASLRHDSTPTVSVAKSPAPAARMSASVRCQCARFLPADSTQAVTRAWALPRSLRDSTRSVSRRCTRSAVSRSAVRA